MERRRGREEGGRDGEKERRRGGREGWREGEEGGMEGGREGEGRDGPYKLMQSMYTCTCIHM